MHSPALCSELLGVSRDDEKEPPPSRTQVGGVVYVLEIYMSVVTVCV